MPADSETAPFNNVARYEAFLDVARNRLTNRAFAPWEIPREHFEMTSGSRPRVTRSCTGTSRRST